MMNDELIYSSQASLVTITSQTFLVKSIHQQTRQKLDPYAGWARSSRSTHTSATGEIKLLLFFLFCFVDSAPSGVCVTYCLLVGPKRWVLQKSQGGTSAEGTAERQTERQRWRFRSGIPAAGRGLWRSPPSACGLWASPGCLAAGV